MMLCCDIISGEYMIGNLASMGRGKVVSTMNSKGKTGGEGHGADRVAWVGGA